MDLSINQSLKQEQKLILTNEIKLSLKLLQMPMNDLEEFIEKELEENPILEIDYDSEEAAGNDNEEASADYGDGEASDDYEDNKVERILQQSASGNYQGEISYGGNDEDDNNPFNYISQASTLKDYLIEQMIDRTDGKEVRDICLYLIECINEDGFITEDMREIAVILRKPYNLVHSAIEIIKDLQPWGIGAKDFRESLLIQLKKRNILDKNLHDIITKYLELLADNKLKELAKLLGIGVEAAQQYADIIKTLEPKPSRGFYTGEDTGYIVPEAFIKKIGKDFYIIMNDDQLPRLNINSYYYDVIKEENNPEAVSYVKDKVSTAVALIKGIEQRRNTIYRILEKIIEYQREYFDKGGAYLKPMSLKDLSMDLNLHESTVSRAVKDKYISLPNGTVKIKDLFTNGISQKENQEDISTNIIKKEIERLIKEENKRKPLSDQEICDRLNETNMNISRRTVAKYREELGIKPSGKRKVYI